MRVCPECERRTEAEFCSSDGSRTIDEAVLRDTSDPFLGRVLADRYRILGALGRGGMARVYVADQFAMKRRVAIKVIRASDATDPNDRISMIQRFQREAQATSRLSHPNTVRVFDFGHTEDGVMYLAMELLRGRTLTRVLSTEGALPPRRAIRICAQIAKSLAEAHDNDIIHRDLKPDNIMLTEVVGARDFVKVLDFGIARVVSPGTDGAQSITKKGDLMGTPTYMSPEQATGYSATFSSDLYSLGVILFECLAGHPPYAADTPLAVLMKHAHAAVPSLAGEEHAGEIPAGLRDLVERLLSKQPMARPRSAIELATLLENLAPSEAGRARFEPTPAAGRRRFVETAQQFRQGQARKQASADAADFDERPTRVIEPIFEPVRIREDAPHVAQADGFRADKPQPLVRRDPARRDGPFRMSSEKAGRVEDLFSDDVELIVAEQRRRMRRRIFVIALIGLFLAGALVVTTARHVSTLQPTPKAATPAAVDER